MKKLLLFSFLLLSSLSMMADASVTNTYVENPDFEARFAGWINNGFYYQVNRSFGKKHGKVYMERWVSSGSKLPNVEICQDLYLPVGTYRLTAGCQNIQQSGQIAECKGAVLYANDESVKVTASNDYSVTFTVLQGVTHIGFKVTSTDANWAAFDNVRLVRLSTDIEAEHAELQKLITNAEKALGEGEGAAELAACISEAKALIESGTDENIGALAKQLSDLTLNYRILNATGTAPTITTNKYVAAGATILLGRMTLSSSSNILEKGFCWSEQPEPTIFDNRSTRTFSSNGDIYRMEKLTPGTMYYVRPYVITKKYKLTYGDVVKVPTLQKGAVTADYDNGGSTDENSRIYSAIQEILWLYNNLSSVKGIKLSVHYGAQTQTADCSYGGYMRVGPNASYQQTGTVLHETNHGVGVGTSDVWWNGNYRADGDRGKWLGPRATQMIQFLNKDDGAYMTGDNTHMWPISSYNGLNYGINGAHEDTYNPENTLLYYGNVLITHALHQDGLVCSESVGFASPAYTFAQEDETKYYIKTTDETFGNETSYLYVNEDGSLSQKSMSAAQAQADDNSAWNIVYTPKTAYYSLRNVGTGRLLTCSSQRFRTSTRTSPSTTERVQLLPSRKNFVKGPLNTPSYWIIIGKTAMKANSQTIIGGANFDANDDNTKQHWLILTAEEVATFDSYCIDKAMPTLDEILAAAKASVQTAALPLSEEMSLEAAATPLTELIAQTEAEKEGYNVEDIENAISNLRETFIAYLGNVKPASATQPIPATWLIDNPSFNENADGWTGGPASISSGIAAFSQTKFDTYQTISPELPAGNYVLSVNAFQRPGTYQNTYADWAEGKETVKAQLYATFSGQTADSGQQETLQQTIHNIWDGASETRKTGQFSFYSNLYIPSNAVAANSWFADGCYENQLTIGLAVPSTLLIGISSQEYGTSWWTCFDNFGLLYYGPYDTGTGIHEIQTPMAGDSDACYSLDGRRVNKAQLKHGIYLWKGKKILF